MRALTTFTILLCVAISCSQPTTPHKPVSDSSQTTDTTANKHTVCKAPPIQILMHNRQGIRINYNISEQELELWFSPKAGKSVAIFDRNFSNRDDHTRLFDKISFPNLSKDDFVSCHYTPYHASIQFKNQVMHLASLFDQPVLFIWFEKNEMIDFKTDKADHIAERSHRIFHSKHSNRGYTFDYVAYLAETDSFQHQLQTAYGRSDYARALMSPNQPIFIGAGLEERQIKPFILKIRQPTDSLVQQSLNTILEQLKPGSLKLHDTDDLERVYELNKMSCLLEQDASGYMPATIKEVGCLPYIRDGAWAFSYGAYTGWPAPLNDWNRYLLSNPTVIETETPQGKLFGQLVGPITKWEEDGAFHAIWSAFTYYTQTGDRTFIEGPYLQNLQAAMDWLERYCYDRDRQLFGRYYYVETALRHSRDDGWDNAIGKPSTMWAPKNFKDQVIVRSYDTYINNLNYSNYLMLAAISEGSKRQAYFEKALQLEKQLAKFYVDSLPDYGILHTKEGKDLIAKSFEFSYHDYIWGLSVPLLHYDPLKTMIIRRHLFDFLQENLKENYAATYFGLLAAMDSEFLPTDSILMAIERVAKEYYSPGRYLPMPYMLGEQTVIDHGNYYTDIRPMPFAAGPFMAAIMNLTVRRLPFGLALRGNSPIEEIFFYEYKDAKISFSNISSDIQAIQVNDTVVTTSYQIPENLLKAGHNLITGSPAPASTQQVLIYSSMQLDRLSGTDTYHLSGFGKNYLIFKNLKKDIQVRDTNGNILDFELTTQDQFTQIAFNGFGNYVVKVMR